MALIPCTECGKQISDSAKACPGCGCPVDKPVYIKCAECGHDIPKNVAACPECGCPVEIKIEQPKQADTGEDTIADLQKAAEQGKADAQFKLGVMYANGKCVLQDYKKAIYWIQKAADQGNADAQYNLGNMYIFGQGVPKNHSKAAYWLKKSREPR